MFGDCFGGLCNKRSLTLPLPQTQELRLWHANCAVIVYFDGHGDARNRYSFNTTVMDSEPKIALTPFWTGMDTDTRNATFNGVTSKNISIRPD